MKCPQCAGRGFTGIPYVTADTCRLCKGRKYLNRAQSDEWRKRKAQSERDKAAVTLPALRV